MTSQMTPTEIITLAERLGCRPYRLSLIAASFECWADRVLWAETCEHRASINPAIIPEFDDAIRECDRQAGYRL